MNRPETLSHEQAIELLPWLVSDSLAAGEKQSVLEHARCCVACRRDIAELEALRDNVTGTGPEAAIPAPDMRRINRRIDAYEARRSRLADAWAGFRAFFARPLHVALAAQSAVIVALLAVLYTAGDPPPVYTTLSDAEPLPPGDYLRVVVAMPVDAARWDELLDRYGLAVIDGPSERGVATLAFGDAASASGRNAVAADVELRPEIRYAQPFSVERP